MRGFEVLLLVVLLPTVLPRSIAPAGLRRAAARSAVLCLAAHWIAEGLRWQMSPAYLLTIAFAIRHLRPSKIDDRPGDHLPGTNDPGTKKSRAPLIGLALPAYLAAWILSLALPVFQLSTPSGPHPVGTLSRQWIDEARIDPFDESRPRKLMAQFWYPARPAGSRTGAYWSGKSPWFLSHWSLVSTSSHPEAPSLTGEPLPVILYNHCYTCPVMESTQLMQELASHGFVVVSVAHPFEELVTRFPDGELLRGHGEHMSAVRGQFPLPEFYERLRDASETNREAMFRELIEGADLIEQSLRLWTADSLFVLDKLNELQANDPVLADRLDLDRVGAAGYSLGGIVAGQLCVERADIAACVNVDCLASGDMIDDMPSQPLMLMESEAFRGANQALYDRARGPIYRVTLAGTTHQNFGDLTLQFPFMGWISIPESMGKVVGTTGPLIGDIEPRRATVLENAYIHAFFRRYLQGLETPLLDGPAERYPEITLHHRSGSSQDLEPDHQPGTELGTDHQPGTELGTETEGSQTGPDHQPGTELGTDHQPGTELGTETEGSQTGPDHQPGTEPRTGPGTSAESSTDG